MSGNISAYTETLYSSGYLALIFPNKTEKYFTSLNDKLTEGRATNTYPNF